MEEGTSQDYETSLQVQTTPNITILHTHIIHNTCIDTDINTGTVTVTIPDADADADDNNREDDNNTNTNTSTSTVCRACMEHGEGEQMQSIFQEGLAQMMMTLAKVNIQHQDGLPQELCCNCVTRLRDAAYFKQLCERSDSLFRNLRNQVKKEDNEEDHDFDDRDAAADDNEDFFECKIEPEQEQDSNDVEEAKDEFECHICSRMCSGKKGLKKHMLLHKNKRYGCNLCSREFLKKEQLKKHISKMHGWEEVLGNQEKCQYCDVEAPDKQAMNKHMKACHPEYLPKRKNSAPRYLDALKMEAGSQLVDKSLDTVVTRAGGAVATIKEIKQEHVDGAEGSPRLILEVTYRCEICNIGYDSQQSYAAHMSRHSGAAPPKDPKGEFPCDSCDKVFMKRKNLKQHSLTHVKVKLSKCSLCYRSFTRPDQLILHMNNHTGKKRHQCPHCDKGFNMLSTLKDHLRTHSGEKPFLCAICGKGFSQNTNLKQHLMRHSATKPFECPTCQAKFVSKGELDAHLRKHTGEHPFVCDTCGTGFTTSSSLVKHKRIHSGERPYACDLCPLRFTALGTLKNHRRTHTGEKPFACTHCTRAFAQKSDLVSHIRTHTGERPYVCAVCGAPYQQSSALKSHMKSHHPLLVDQKPPSIVVPSSLVECLVYKPTPENSQSPTAFANTELSDQKYNIVEM